MSHEPPVPPGNQSPFPVQEPPRAHADDPVIAPVIVAAVPPSPDPTPTRTPASASAASPGLGRRLPLGTIVGAAAGVGAIAFGVAALLFPGPASAGRKKAARRKR